VPHQRHAVHRECSVQGQLLRIPPPSRSNSPSFTPSPCWTDPPQGWNAPRQQLQQCAVLTPPFHPPTHPHRHPTCAHLPQTKHPLPHTKHPNRDKHSPSFTPSPCWTDPLQGWMRPASVFSSVLLPAPFGPSTNTRCPLRTVNVTSDSTGPAAAAAGGSAAAAAAAAAAGEPQPMARSLTMRTSEKQGGGEGRCSDTLRASPGPLSLAAAVSPGSATAAASFFNFSSNCRRGGRFEKVGLSSLNSVCQHTSVMSVAACSSYPLPCTTGSAQDRQHSAAHPPGSRPPPTQ
jgi:hypothetical protein